MDNSGTYPSKIFSEIDIALCSFLGLDDLFTEYFKKPEDYEEGKKPI